MKNKEYSITISAPSKEKSIRFSIVRELKDYLDLLYILILRQLSIRYKQTTIGVLWILLQPIVMMLVLMIIFGSFSRGLISSGEQYSLFLLSGITFWQFFAKSVSNGMNSILADAHLLTKIYFPRIILPIAYVSADLVDLLMGIILLFILIPLLGGHFTSNIIYFPIAIILIAIFAIGCSLWLSVLQVFWRDIQFIVPFIIQMWMFLSAVIFPINAVSPKLEILFKINPITGILEFVRWSLLDYGTFHLFRFSLAVFVIIITFISGLMYFCYADNKIIDRL